jgi:hypothetical protein
VAPFTPTQVPDRLRPSEALTRRNQFYGRLLVVGLVPAWILVGAPVGMPGTAHLLLPSIAQNPLYLCAALFCFVAWLCIARLWLQWKIANGLQRRKPTFREREDDIKRRYEEEMTALREQAAPSDPTRARVETGNGYPR